MPLSGTQVLEWKSNSCQRETDLCQLDPKFIQYTPGRTYLYRVQSETRVHDPSDPQNDQLWRMDAGVEVSAHTSCDLSLHLVNVQLSGQQDESQQQELERELESQPIGFVYSDGHVGRVCPSRDDQQWTQDVKRALISGLQMSAQSLERTSVTSELDILGECETTYRPISSRFQTYVIEKTKRLNNCIIN